MLYFKGERGREIQRNITPKKYQKLFAQLSKRQKEIISDKESRCIVVAAGPGSGKTRVLVHKLASLLLLEDVKHEQLLMLTFSRAAATEFKQQLIALIGEAAHYVEIKTFHSYSFDLLGRIGNLENEKDVVAKAAEMYQPLVENLIAHKCTGTSCILTQTNEEAVILVALLRKYGIQSKLIQSMEGFRFSYLQILVSAKTFSSYIKLRSVSSLGFRPFCYLCFCDKTSIT